MSRARARGPLGVKAVGLLGALVLTLLAAVLSALVPATAAAAEARAGAAPVPTAHTATHVEQPRSFGHVLGDVLTQRVLLQQAGRAVELAALPVADRVGLWLERGVAQVETDTEGGRWLVLRYQVVNAPRSLTSITLPALGLALRSGGSLAVPAWPISIAPLTPEAAFGQGELQAMRPDRAVALLPTAALERQVVGWSLALLAVLALWAGSWSLRNALDRRRLPFARAWAVLQRLHRAQPSLALEQQPAAWRGVHHAINTHAGWAVQAASLPRLLAQRPELQILQPQLEAFYRASAQRFFAPGAASDEARTGSPESPRLLPLARALRQWERRA